MTLRITSPANVRIKRIVRLQKDSAARREYGLFCIESLRELQRALACGFEVVELYLCPERFTGAIDAPDVCHVSPAVLEKIAYRHNPEGFVAVLEGRRLAARDLPRGDGSGLYIICAGIEKPGNIGAILRSADAAGVTAMLVDDPSFDLYNPNCIRSSTGAVFSLPVVCDDRRALLEALQQRSVRLIAATPEGAGNYTQTDWSPPVAIVLGAEAQGLDAFWRSAAAAAVRIDQRGTVDSLNVSVAAALLMFEAAREVSHTAVPNPEP